MNVLRIRVRRCLSGKPIDKCALMQECVNIYACIGRERERERKRERERGGGEREREEGEREGEREREEKI